MNTFQPKILLVGFSVDELKLIVNSLEYVGLPPDWECADADSDVAGKYRKCGPDLVFLSHGEIRGYRIKALLAELTKIRLQQGDQCRFVILESDPRPFAARTFFDSGADVVAGLDDVQSLGREYLRAKGASGEDNQSIEGLPASNNRLVEDSASDTLPRDILLEHQAQSQRLETIGTLAGGIAHDFNNILAAIMGFAHSALLDVDEESATASDLNSIVGSVERAARLTTQIMAFSKSQKIIDDLVDFTRVISEGLEMSRAAIPSHIVFRTEIDDKIGYIRADPTQWQQVILNLCLNSAQAMGEGGGTITIGLRRIFIGSAIGNRAGDIKPGEYNELTVSDDGSGMSEDVRRRIFEPFFTSQKPGQGTGLGMAVVHGIVSNHKGTISVTSRIGEGSRITILVPCSGLNEALPKEVENVNESIGTERILFVDDEVDIGIAYATPLRRLGYDVTVCKSGIEALKLFHADPAKFDLVITDQIMPELSGSELARKIAANGNKTPVMICSGYHTERISELKSVPNVHEVLRKPVTPQRMGEAIRSIMDEKRSAV